MPISGSQDTSKKADGKKGRKVGSAQKQETKSQEGSHTNGTSPTRSARTPNTASAVRLPDKMARPHARAKKSDASDSTLKETLKRTENLSKEGIENSTAANHAEVAVPIAADANDEAGSKGHVAFGEDEGPEDVAEDDTKASAKTNPKTRSKTQRIIGEAAGVMKAGVNALMDWHAADIDLEVKSKSPQIAVLWGQQEHKRIAKILEQHNMTITQDLELPDNDRYLFIAERSKQFMDDLKRGGSVAAELEAMRLEFERAITLQKNHSNKGGGVEYWIWPLHDATFNRILLLRAFTADHAEHEAISCGYRCVFQLVQRIGVWLGMSIVEGDLLTIIQSHFGCDVAVAFLFTLHYIFSLWVLFFPCIIFHITKSSIELDQYRKLWSPIFQFGLLFPWSLFFSVKWKKRVMWASETWRADILEDDDSPVNDSNKDFRPLQSDRFKAWLESQDDPSYFPNWLRALRTLAIIPLLIGDCILMSMVLAFVFWFEMWIVFEWGQCAEINFQNQNNECQGADVKHGFFGGLFEAVPGLIEGLLFELILALSKALARFAVRLQNWNTETQKELAYISQLVFFELVGKFGWIAVLAVIFVPDWVDSETKRNDEVFVYNEASCSEEALKALDSKVFSMFGIPEQSLSCLKTRTQYDTRLALFEIAVAAPFFVAQIVSMSIKTLVPSLVVRFRACFPNDHGRVHGCYCRCCRFLLRFLSCACLFDIESVGVEECNYIYAGDKVGEEIFNLTLAEPGEKGTVPASAWQTPLESRASLQKIDDEIRRESLKRAASLKSGNSTERPSILKVRSDQLLRVTSATSGSMPDSEAISKRGDRTMMTAWAEGVREAFVPLDENLETGMHFFWVISFAAFYPLGACLAVGVYIFDIRGDLFRLTIIQKRNFRKSPKANLVMLAKFVKFAITSAIVFNVVVCFVTYKQLSRWSDNPKYKGGLYDYFWEVVFICLGVIAFLYMVQVLVNCSFHTGLAEKLEASNQARREQVSVLHENDPILVPDRWASMKQSKKRLKEKIALRLRAFHGDRSHLERRPFVGTTSQGGKVGKALDKE